MNDYQKIANLISHYSRIYDDGDFEGYARLFEHGEITGPVGDFRTIEEIADYHRSSIVVGEDGRPNMIHAISNLIIEVEEGADTASAECVVTVLTAAENVPLQIGFVGYYIDTFHKIDGKWWFKTRHCEPRFYGDMRAMSKQAAAAAEAG